jgi:tetratricopeptide (TPR) repeat protein
MNPRERLNSARTAADEGRYEEALREYIWFHEHALDHEPALYGVRLSFALAYWIDLSKVYPEARVALEQMRDRKVAKLLKGEGDRATFHDVARMNEFLDCEHATSDLFVTIDAAFPDLASQCASLALPALVKAGDCQLARRYLPAPAETLRRFSDALNEDADELTSDQPLHAPTLDAYVYIYAERVLLLAAVLRGVGESDEAERIEAKALELVRSPPVREAIRAVLAAHA